jgi:two-component system, NtrC family, sensor kinase
MTRLNSMTSNDIAMVDAVTSWGTGRALLEGKVIHIPDVLADPDFTWKEGQRLGGFRTVLGVPMLRQGVVVGVLALTRSAVRPFSDEQIALVENFAAQAVIAIENVRLLSRLLSLEECAATSPCRCSKRAS